MMSSFAQPFGLAWLGAVMWIAVILVGSVLIALFSKQLFSLFNLIVRIAMIPWNIIMGKPKKGLNDVKNNRIVR